MTTLYGQRTIRDLEREAAHFADAATHAQDAAKRATAAAGEATARWENAETALDAARRGECVKIVRLTSPPTLCRAKTERGIYCAEHRGER